MTFTTLAPFGLGSPVPAAGGVALAFAIAWGFAGLSDVLVAICVTAVVVTAVATIAKRQIGGQTGDVLGAVAQVAEIAVLVTLSAR